MAMEWGSLKEKKSLAWEILIFFSVVVLLICIHFLKEHLTCKYSNLLKMQSSFLGSNWEETKQTIHSEINRTFIIIQICNYSSVIIFVFAYPIRIAYHIIKWAVKTLRVKEENS